jgi:hypothetical protein
LRMRIVYLLCKGNFDDTDPIIVCETNRQRLTRLIQMRVS